MVVAEAEAVDGGVDVNLPLLTSVNGGMDVNLPLPTYIVPLGTSLVNNKQMLVILPLWFGGIFDVDLGVRTLELQFISLIYFMETVVSLELDLNILKFVI